MRAWKIISGILSILLFGIIVIQSSAAGLVNALEGEGGISGSVGIVCGVLILTGGILSLASNNAKGKGANIALFVIFGLAGVIGITLHDNYADLVIWSIWALLNALIALIAAIVKKKDNPFIVVSDEEKPLLGNQVSTELIEGPVVPCPVNFNDPELEAPIKRMASLLREKQWKEADACCERMLDQNYEAALPYIGKLMVERQVNIPSYLSWCVQPLESSKYYQSALKYADDELKAFLEKSNSKILQRQQNELTEKRYQDCLKSMEQAEKSMEFEQIAERFDGLGEYKDVKDLANKCREVSAQCRKKEKTVKCVVLSILGLLCLCAIIVSIYIWVLPFIQEKHAMNLLKKGKYDKAYQILMELDKDDIILENKNERALKYLESGEYDLGYALLTELGKVDIIRQNKQNRASSLIAQGEFDSAYSLLTELGDTDRINQNKLERVLAYIDNEDYDSAKELLNDVEGLNTWKCKYAEGMILLHEKKYEEAYVLLEEGREFEEIDKSTYERAQIEVANGNISGAYELLKHNTSREGVELLGEIVPQYSQELFANAEVGTTVLFGKYFTEVRCKSRYPLEWIVLERKNNKLLLLCKQAIMYRPYYQGEKSSNNTYAISGVQKWLKTIFISDAFSDEEKNMLIETKIDIPKGIKVQENTEKVFLLSADDVRKYSKIPELDGAWECSPTAYAMRVKGTSFSESTCRWWLRTYGSDSILYVDRYGVLSAYGILDTDNIGVRPAIWITIQ